MSQVLVDTLHNVFCNSLNFMCIYNTVENSIIDLNPAMKSHAEKDSSFTVQVIQSSENKRYIKIDNIPCLLTTLAVVQDGVALMVMSLAHTKKWTQSSDLVTLTDVTSDGVWEWFPELNFEYMSERFWNILGYEQKDMEENPMSWMGFLNSDDKIVAEKMCEEHIKSKGRIPYMVRARYTHQNGKEVIVLCRGTVVDWMPDGRPWRLLGTHTDITDLVKKDAIEAKTKFISRMSHEIRSPICTILNECELLGDKTGVIEDTCKQLISLTDDILNIDKMKAEEPVLQAKEDSLEDVLSKSTKRHRIQAKKKGMKIRLMVDEVPSKVLIDKPKFNQVLDNLIGNSFKYSEGGCIVLDVEYDNETSICSIRVTDDGIGMDPSFHTAAFEELVQGDSTMLGAGIGLTLSRILARVMGGDVTIEKSSLGNGTTMLFTSYLFEQETEASKNKPSNFRVLIVDDIKINRVILKRRLQNMMSTGLRITGIDESVNGQDAVDKFAECDGNFQLVLMDCHMPILDGFDATVKIHDLCNTLGIEAVPVVAVTASVSSDIKEKCLSSGIKYVVTKPYSEIELMASIQSSIDTF